MFYKKAYKKALAERDAWRHSCLESDKKVRTLNRTVRDLKGICDWLEKENARLCAKAPSTFDKMTYQKLKCENEELREQLKRAEMKLSAREKADRAFKDNCCFVLDFFGETIRECNKQDEQERNRADFLLEANEMLADENRRLRRKLGKPGKAVTLEKEV